MIGMPPFCTGLGSAGDPADPVVLTVEVEGLPGRGAPEPGDDRHLLLVPVEPLPQLRERDAVGGVLGLEPAGPDAELHPAAAHLVDLRDRDRQGSGQPEGGRRHERAEPDPGGLAGQSGEGHPGVGRPGQAVPAHRQVVVGPEEGVEAGLLGAPGDGEEIVVRGAHLGLGEDPELHPPTLARPAGRAAGRATGGVLLGRTGQDGAKTINSEVMLVFRKKSRGQVIGAELQEGFAHSERRHERGGPPGGRAARPAGGGRSRGGQACATRPPRRRSSPRSRQQWQPPRPRSRPPGRASPPRSTAGL